MIEIVNATTSELIESARKLLLEYANSLDFDLCFQDFDRELEEFPGGYQPPGGRLLLGLVDKQPVGCIGLRDLGEGIAELKRLYVQPEFRRWRLGRGLADAVIAAARDIGYQAIRLDTLTTMVAANELYRTLGFKAVAPYRKNPLADAVYFELTLSQQQQGEVEDRSGCRKGV